MEKTNNMKWKEIKDLVGNIPPPRHGHRCVRYGKFIIVLGGGNEGLMSDVAILNTTNNKWFSPAAAHSSFLACAAHGTALVDTDIYVFGGILEYGDYSNQIYKISLLDWSIILCDVKIKDEEDEPVPRLGHSFTPASSNRIFMFGGLTNSSTIFVSTPRYLNDLYILKIPHNNTKLTWIKPDFSGQPPSPRESHSALIHFYKNRETLIIYGGMCGNRLGDVHFLDIETLTWTQPLILGEPPPSRSLHIAGICQNKMIIFGGWIPINEKHKKQQKSEEHFESEWECTNDVAVLNLENLSWETYINNEKAENAPKARAGHCGCVINDRLYIWSGRDGYRKSWSDQVCCKDLWFLEITKAEPPSKLMMDGNDTMSVSLKWDSIHNADFYLVQVMKVGPNTICNSRDVKNIMERNKQNTKEPVNPISGNSPLLPALKLVAPAQALKPEDLLKSSIKPDLPNSNLMNTNIISDQLASGRHSSMDEPFIPLSNFTPQKEDKIDPDSNNLQKEVLQNIQNDQKLVKHTLTTSTPFSNKNVTKIDSLMNRNIPPLAVSIVPTTQIQKPKEIIQVTPIYNQYKSFIFSEIPSGKWFESVIVSEPKACVTQFFIDLNENLSTGKNSANRKTILLESNFTYRLRVASVNSCGIGNFSAPLTFSTTAPGLPSPPKNVSIVKNANGIEMSWESGNNDTNLEYFVYISKPISPLANIPQRIRDWKYLYDKIYQGKETKCMLLIDDFQLGTREKPFLMLRIVAKNFKGYGPVTQIKWFKDEMRVKNDNSAYYEQHPIPLRRLKYR